jgi:hypothetical protein
MSGETAKAARAYEDFLALRKDADSDTSKLKEAKIEFGNLKPVAQTP